MNCSNENNLSYIECSELNLNKNKVLIGTGSKKPFVRPEIAKRYFVENTRTDSFKIFIAHGKSAEITIPKSHVHDYLIFSTLN